MGIAFGAALLFSLWWVLLKPVDYRVSELDIQFSTPRWDDRTRTNAQVIVKGQKVDADYASYTAIKDGNPLMLFISYHSHGDSLTRRIAEQAADDLKLNDDRYSSVYRKEFSNVIVICALKSNCSETKKGIVFRARQRVLGAR
jgi:hypothetical protein